MVSIDVPKVLVLGALNPERERRELQDRARIAAWHHRVRPVSPFGTDRTSSCICLASLQHGAIEIHPDIVPPSRLPAWTRRATGLSGGDDQGVVHALAGCRKGDFWIDVELIGCDHSDVVETDEAEEGGQPG